MAKRLRDDADMLDELFEGIWPDPGQNLRKYAASVSRFPNFEYMTEQFDIYGRGFAGETGTTVFLFLAATLISSITGIRFPK